MAETGIRQPGGGIKGAVDRLLAQNLETILAIPGRRLYRRYERAARDAAAVQAALLAEILGRSAGTVFGREHGFDRIRGYDEFCRAVPLRDYEGHRPYVNRHAAGEADVLFPGKPMMYTRSSGTTAESKLLPFTAFNFERAIRNRGKLWLYGLMRAYPGIYRGKSYSVVSPAEEGRTPDGTPFGSLSGVMRQNIPGFMHLTHAAPWETTLISDYESRTYCQLRFGVPSDVTVVLTGNPSTVLNFASRADAWKERLIRDVRDGTLDPGLDLDPARRALLESRLEPAPGRAAELERAATLAGGTLRPADYWPRLGLVHTWTQGNCALMLPKIRPWLREGTPILDFGYIASEVMATDLVDPATQGSLLQVQHAFYEFAPLEGGDDLEPHVRLLLAHELEVGRRYYIYVTTLSGLYRYDMNDVVEVVGRFHDAPVIRFL
ncbi:MAG TPA: GH3 auxin-responsive promoter family protein, partial [Polyangia bacterium]|nr:GH3 auxin-responsive promoter family protein [Polyangia bacterium]